MCLILLVRMNGNWKIGSRTATRDAGKINFRAVDVVAKVAANEACGSLPSNRVEGDAG